MGRSIKRREDYHTEIAYLTRLVRALEKDDRLNDARRGEALTHSRGLLSTLHRIEGERLGPTPPAVSEKARPPKRK